MTRPRTLAEVARRRNAAGDFSMLMREFLDEKKFRPGLEPVKRPAGEK